MRTPPGLKTLPRADDVDDAGAHAAAQRHGAADGPQTGDSAMNLPRHAEVARSALRPVRLLLAGCTLGTLSLGAGALGGAPAGASSSPTPLRYFQKQSVVTFTNAAGAVLQGYPPVGGHVLEDDVDYVGNHTHHAAHPSMTDHLFCTVVTAPATATCFVEFATGDSLLYADDISLNLASSAGTIPLSGGTETFAGDAGSVASNPVGNSNNSDLVFTLHKG
jgi:hypothetical protein